MSGHKRATVTISQDEYRRLYEAEQKNVYSSVEIPLINYQVINQQTNDELLNEVNSLSHRQERYIDSIKDLNNKIQDIEYAASKSLVDKQVEFYNQLAQNSVEIWKNAEEYIDHQSKEISQAVVQQHDQMQQQIIQLENRLLKQNKNKQLASDASVEWINNSMVVHDFIKGNYRLADELLDEFLTYEKQWEIALSNLQNQFYEASLSTAQQVFTSLTRLRLKLEKEEAERAQLILAINNQCQLLLNKIALNQTCPAIDMNGNTLDDNLVVDDWVEGKLSGLQDEVVGMENYFNSSACTEKNEELKAYLRIISQEKSQQVEGLIMDARYYALNSQLRYSIAQQVMLSLVEQGFRPVEGGFSQNNYNGQYVARAINHDGGEVTITIDPDKVVPLKNEIHIHSKDEQVMSQHELKQRSNEIRNSLINHGLEMSIPVEVGAHGDPTKAIQGFRKDQRKLAKINQ